MPSLPDKNKNAGPPIDINVVLDKLALAIKAIEQVVEKGRELTFEQAVDFCGRYVKALRVLNHFKQRYNNASETFSWYRNQLVGADNLNRKAFLASFALCWSHPSFAEFQSELTEIAEEDLASLEYAPLLVMREDNFELNKIVLSALLFSGDDRAARCFFSKPKEDRDQFVTFLANKDSYALLKFLAKLFSAAETPATEKPALIKRFRFVLAQIRKRHSEETCPANVISSISRYVTGYFAYFSTVTVSYDDIEERKAEFALLADCFAVPGVLAQVGPESVRHFLQSVPSECWGGAVYQLTDTATEWLEKTNPNPSQEENCLVVTAIKATISELLATNENENPQRLADSQNLLQGLVSVITVPQTKLSLWDRFLNMFRKKPVEPKFTDRHIQQLICCAPKESAQKLLQRYYPQLSAAQFIQFMKNPVLCAANRLLLCNILFDPDQAALREQVFQQLGKKHPLILAEWVKPLRKQEAGLILTQAFSEESFQKACAKLELYQVISLQEQFKAYPVKKGRACLAAIYENKMGGSRSSKAVDLQALATHYPHLTSQIKEDPAFAVLMLYFFAKTQAEQEKLDQVLAGTFVPKEVPVVVVSQSQVVIVDSNSVGGLNNKVASTQASLKTNMTFLGEDESKIISLRKQIDFSAKDAKLLESHTKNKAREIRLIDSSRDIPFLAKVVSASSNAVALSKAAQQTVDLHLLTEALAIVRGLVREAEAAHQEAQACLYAIERRTVSEYNSALEFSCQS